MCMYIESYDMPRKEEIWIRIITFPKHYGPNHRSPAFGGPTDYPHIWGVVNI